MPEPAVAIGEDPRSYARLMSAVYDATMACSRAPARPREVIGESWQRLIASGLHDRAPDDIPVVRTAGLEMLRRSSGLMDVLDEIAHGLESQVAEGANKEGWLAWTHRTELWSPRPPSSCSDDCRTATAG